MSWFKGIFGKEEEAPIAAGATSSNDDIPAAEPVVASGKKLKLNFKRIPKSAVQAIADNTIGQERPVIPGNTPTGPRGGITDIFNQNAADITKPSRPMAMKPMGPKL